MDHLFKQRLKSKSVENSIINSIAEDFNLTPILAETYFKQIQNYFSVHTGLELSSGQIHYLAVDDREPAGKPVALCKKISVRLNLHIPEQDIDIYHKSGLRGLRQHRLLRITKEAIEQDALLSQLDLAVLLGVNESTAGYYVREYASIFGRDLPTRGNIQLIGSGQTHKKEIIALYLKGYLVPSICQRTNHSQEAVERYLRDFEAIKLLYTKDFDINSISLITRLSISVVSQYIDLLPTDP